MPTNRIPKAIHSRTLAQSVFVNLVAQLLLSFSQPMLGSRSRSPARLLGRIRKFSMRLCEADAMKAVSRRAGRARLQSRQSDMAGTI